MNGAIFFASKYGSTAEYAKWIAEATGLPLFDVNATNADPSTFEFLVIGSPVFYYKLIISKWVKCHSSQIKDIPVILFTVSGAPAGAKLDSWIAECLPKEFVVRMKHVVLRGRQNPADLTWWDRMMLIIVGLMNRDPVAREDELKGFNYMNKSSIAPAVKLIRQFQSNKASS